MGGASGGRFESAIYDDDFNFYVTEDSVDGALHRYTPKKKFLKKTLESKEYWKILTRKGGVMKYLVLQPESDNSGTFRWSLDESEGRKSASEHFFNSEGIDYHNGSLFFIAEKKIKSCTHSILRMVPTKVKRQKVNYSMDSRIKSNISGM